MRFEIRHRTTYTFDSPVFLEPHTLRLRPRSGPDQSVEAFDLSFNPQPAGLSEGLDFEGNHFEIAWFDGTTESLMVELALTIHTALANPFDYLLLPAGLDPLPWALTEPAAQPYLRRPVSPPDDPVAALARDLADQTGSVVPFLTALNHSLHRIIAIDLREDGDPFEPAHTLAIQHGSCRDLAVLFVDACRVVGVPARFVSGYQQGDPEQDRRYLHAWPEAWVPGAGWRGYDPTLGLVVADAHVAVAAAASSADAAPISGSFRGSARSTMTVDLVVTTSPD